MRHGELFLRGHAAAGGLFTVAEGGVEEVTWFGLSTLMYSPAEEAAFQHSQCRASGQYKAKLLFLGKRLELVIVQGTGSGNREQGTGNRKTGVFDVGYELFLESQVSKANPFDFAQGRLWGTPFFCSLFPVPCTSEAFDGT